VLPALAVSLVALGSLFKLTDTFKVRGVDKDIGVCLTYIAFIATIVVLPQLVAPRNKKIIVLFSFLLALGLVSATTLFNMFYYSGMAVHVAQATGGYQSNFMPPLMKLWLVSVLSGMVFLFLMLGSYTRQLAPLILVCAFLIPFALGKKPWKTSDEWNTQISVQAQSGTPPPLADQLSR
jgi:glucan phosphoethanolaminetransferase (alkaline phosphatase superfamily)